jgi:hypothetical protein
MRGGGRMRHKSTDKMAFDCINKLNEIRPRIFELKKRFDPIMLNFQDLDAIEEAFCFVYGKLREELENDKLKKQLELAYKLLKANSKCPADDGGFCTDRLKDFLEYNNCEETGCYAPFYCWDRYIEWRVKQDG